jgi:hypothetical protein
MLDSQNTDRPIEEAVAIACSLDPAGLGDRVAEFEHLFAATLVSHKRERAQLRLVLAVSPDEEMAVRDLFAREADCCRFFAFAITREEPRLVVTMGVPPGAEPMLDGFEAFAAAGVTRRPSG